MPRPTLDPIEARVAGALAEKAMATPDQYPMTMNSLVAACNQKSSRDPVTDYSERDVAAAVERLMRRGLAGTTAGAGHRVAKVRHRLDRELGLSRRELAVLTVLLLRGPQTPGELKTRAARLAEFASVSDVEEALWMLSDRDEPLVGRLDRAPGQSADRYVHHLSGEVPESPPQVPVASASVTSAPSSASAAGPSLAGRVDALEAEVARLRAEMEAFRAQFE